MTTERINAEDMFFEISTVRDVPREKDFHDVATRVQLDVVDSIVAAGILVDDIETVWRDGCNEASERCFCLIIIKGALSHETVSVRACVRGLFRQCIEFEDENDVDQVWDDITESPDAYDEEDDPDDWFPRDIL